MAETPEEAELQPGLSVYWEAFRRLDRDRTETMVPIPIPDGGFVFELRPDPLSFSAIDRYARRYGVDGEEFDLLLRLVGDLDDEYRAYLSEKRAG